MMRLKPDKNYSSNTPKFSNMTLYEMAVSMSETGDAQEAFPYLINWLFKDFFDNYKYNDTKYDDSYAYNIAYFLLYNFINRESCSKIPEVFRTKLLKELVDMNLDADFNTIVTGIKNATNELSRLKNIDNTSEITKSDLVTHDVDNTTTGTVGSVGNDTITHNTLDTTNVSSTSEGEVHNQSNTSSSQNDLQTLDTKVESDGTNNSENDVWTRNMNMDYPQSSIANTSQPSPGPSDFGWTYASNGSDNKTDNDTDVTTHDETTNTGTVENESSLSSQNTSTGTTSNEATGNSTLSKTGTDSNAKSETTTHNLNVATTGTVSTSDTINTDIGIDVSETWSGMTGAELNSLQLDLINKYGSFYKRLMNKFENCFISIYVDEERDGWLDPNVDLMSQWQPA